MIPPPVFSMVFEKAQEAALRFAIEWLQKLFDLIAPAGGNGHTQLILQALESAATNEAAVQDYMRELDSWRSECERNRQRATEAEQKLSALMTNAADQQRTIAQLERELKAVRKHAQETSMRLFRMSVDREGSPMFVYQPGAVYAKAPSYGPREPDDVTLTLTKEEAQHVRSLIGHHTDAAPGDPLHSVWEKLKPFTADKILWAGQPLLKIRRRK